jgi:8-oxo-dGTP pyrophosphatase MutT (NUDIX family)
MVSLSSHPLVRTRTMEDEKFYVGQKAFINRDNAVLVLREPNVGVDFPGGKIQKGEEDIIKSLKREVKEETGLDIEVRDPFTSWEIPTFGRLKGHRLLLIGYRCEYLSGDVKISDEHVDFKWVDKGSYKTLDDGKAHFKELEKYFEDG